ncbi:unnamed protein product [Rhizophagus irregularis]|uniref:Uncharacterized protein n=1 Tax=Rhizophagus irregularis TaxID=588596 RepID=A0A915Z2J9_9GLOM|nr:unnamed protein product [Rhizophagus irregularis]
MTQFKLDIHYGASGFLFTVKHWVSKNLEVGCGFLKGKFVACASWYTSVNATSVKLIDNMGFDNMPIISLNGTERILGFLMTPQHQNDDMEFYQMLEEILYSTPPIS